MKIESAFIINLHQLDRRINYKEIGIKLNFITVAGYCLFLSFVFLLICTKSSPIYPFNDWVDSNAFFTMGKGMMNGKVLYRDLFEQKGPLLYFIHGLSYLISNTTFFGVFIFEVISFSAFLLYCHKIMSLFLANKYSIISIPLIAACVSNMSNFSHGDSAEEFSLPLVAISLYYLIHYFKQIYPNPISYKCLLINGIIAGAILWIKFSLLGFWFGWVLTMSICMIVSKQYLRIIKASVTFLIGMFIITIPWIVYFGVNNAIFSWINTYIIINAKYYPAHLTLIGRLKTVVINLLYNMTHSPTFGLLSSIGIIFFVSDRYLKNIIPRISILMCVFLLAFGVYGGGMGYAYYFLIFSPFVIFGFIVILDLLSFKLDNKISYKLSISIILLSLLITVITNMFQVKTFNHNTYILKLKKEDLVQYKFASIINQTKNPTLLNYGTLDLGFYTVTGITPNVKFFENQNIPYSKFPLNMDEQNKYIKDKKVDFLVTRGSGLQRLENSVPSFYDDYTLVGEQTQMFEGTDFKYWLFKKKD